MAIQAIKPLDNDTIHILIDQPIEINSRTTRAAGDALCMPEEKIGPFEFVDQAPTCDRCLRLADKLGIEVPNAAPADAPEVDQAPDESPDDSAVAEDDPAPVDQAPDESQVVRVRRGSMAHRIAKALHAPYEFIDDESADPE